VVATTLVVAPMTEPKDGLTAALAKVQALLPQIKKTKTATVPTRAGGTYTYAYADLSDIAAAVYPLLAEHGLAFVCAPIYEAGRYVLSGRLEHVSGGDRRGVFPLPTDDEDHKVTPQQLGSALTYGRRYLLGCLIGVVTEADDDGKAASTAAPAAKRAPKKAAARALPDIREPLFHDIKTAREGKGWSVEDVQADFALTHDGKKLMDASAKELAQYLGTLQEPE